MKKIFFSINKTKFVRKSSLLSHPRRTNFVLFRGLLFKISLVCLFFFSVESAEAVVRCGETVYHNYEFYVNGDCGGTITRVTVKVWGAVLNPRNETLDVDFHIERNGSKEVAVKIVALPNAPNGSKVYSSTNIDSFIQDNENCTANLNERYSSGESEVVCDVPEDAVAADNPETHDIQKDTTPPEIILNRGIKRFTEARKTISGKAIDNCWCCDC